MKNLVYLISCGLIFSLLNVGCAPDQTTELESADELLAQLSPDDRAFVLDVQHHALGYDDAIGNARFPEIPFDDDPYFGNCGNSAKQACLTASLAMLSGCIQSAASSERRIKQILGLLECRRAVSERSEICLNPPPCTPNSSPSGSSPSDPSNEQHNCGANTSGEGSAEDESAEDESTEDESTEDDEMCASTEN